MGKLRTHSEPLPRGTESVVALFKRAMQLTHVMEIRVTPEEFHVARMMEDDDEPVFPRGESKVDGDVEALLVKISDGFIEPPFDPDRHPYIALVDATDRLTRERLRVCGIMAPKGPLLADYFGLPEDTMPETFMGIRVIYHSLEDRYPDKIVVLGGPTVYFNDATHGVILDTGV